MKNSTVGSIRVEAYVKLSNVNIFILILIMLNILVGFNPVLFAQENPSEHEQNWHMPDLSTSEQNVNIHEAYTEIKDTIPLRGTQYMIRVPNNWNGTLLSDLDYLQSANSFRNLHLLEQGYALSGTKRRPERLMNYDPAHEIHDIISVLDIFESIFGVPIQVIQLGCSGGGTITLAMAEMHPDRIDGAIAGCASTSPWMANTHLDALFVLKALIAPDLPIVDLPLSDPEISEIGAEWLEAIKTAQQTPEGRARIALAITIGQWPAWGGPGKAPLPEPDPENTLELQESMYISLLRLLPSRATFGTGMLEQSAPGQLRWNTGVDYKFFYANGNAFYKEAVEKLYGDANLKLEDDLERINRFPRIKADPSALKWWSSPGRTHFGAPKVPLLRINTSGDGLVYPSMAQGYKELVDEKGYTELFRIAYVNRWGHCTFSLAEWLVAIDTMMERLESGEWPNTDPDSLNNLGESLHPESTSKFYDYQGVKKYNRNWVPSINDYIGGPK